ncbi:hypothetical protein HDU81_000368, partial [Chytriomyces hyalinus]
MSSNFSTTGVYSISNTTDSVSGVTGALIVSGGMAIAKNGFIGANLTVTNNLSVSGTVTVTGTVTMNQQLSVNYTADSTSTGTGSIVTAGGLAVQKNVTFGNALSVAGVTTLNVTTMNSNVSVAGKLTSTNTTDSTSTITGSIITSGGISAAKSLYIGGNASVHDTLTIGSSVNTGSVSVTSGNFINVNSSAFTDTVSNTSAVNAGNYFNYIGTPTILASNPGVIYTNCANVFISGAPIASTNAILTTSYALLIGGPGLVGVLDTTDATNSTNGSLRLAGGLSVSKSIYSGGNLTITGTSNLNALNLSGITVTTNTIDSVSSSTGAITTSGGIGVAKSVMIGMQLTVTTNATIGGTVFSTGTINITSVGTGSVLISGGISIAKSVQIGGNLSLA